MMLDNYTMEMINAGLRVTIDTFCIVNYFEWPEDTAKFENVLPPDWKQIVQGNLDGLFSNITLLEVNMHITMYDGSRIAFVDNAVWKYKDIKFSSQCPTYDLNSAYFGKYIHNQCPSY